MIGFGSIGRGTLPLIDRHLEFDRTRAVVVDPDDRDRGILDQYGVSSSTPPSPTTTTATCSAAPHRRRGAGFLHQPLGRHVVGRHHAAVPRARRAVPRHGGRALARLLLRQGDRQRHPDQPRAALDRDRRASSSRRVAPRPSRAVAPTPAWCRGSSRRRSSTSPAISASTPPSRRSATAPAGPSTCATIGVRGIHIAERDTQRTAHPKPIDVFWNTWSVDGFISEGLQPAELGWGTHESWMPDNARTFDDPSAPASSSTSPAPRHGCAPGARRTASSTGSS